jgi:hypothetical protein
MEFRMDFKEQQQLLREQKAGYEYLRQFNIAKAREATFADRLEGFRQILRFSAHLPIRDSRPDARDVEVARRWMKIRERYADLNR